MQLISFDLQGAVPGQQIKSVRACYFRGQPRVTVGYFEKRTFHKRILRSEAGISKAKTPDISMSL